MKVNVIYEGGGWILERFAKHLNKRLDYVVLQQPVAKHKINYFIPYYFLEKGPWKSIGWFTHQEERPDLNQKFKWAAKNADYCISQSKKYEQLIKSWGVKNVSQIIPGVALNKYKPKIKLGYVGRMYGSTDRKNPEMLKFASSIPFVEVVATNGSIPPEKLPEFYNSLDYVFVPSKIEGGPMCLYEGLACGKEIIAPSGVGVVDEYSRGIIRYKNNDKVSLKEVLKVLYRKRLALRKQVESHTWDSYVVEHDKIFRRFM